MYGENDVEYFTDYSLKSCQKTTRNEAKKFIA